MDPTGVPSSRNPEVSSTGDVVLSLFLFTEYLEIVRSMVMAVLGSSSGMIDFPEQEVSIRVLDGLTMQPRDRPKRSISVQKNSMSSWATVEEMSSMYAKRCARLPKPSSPAIPLMRRSCALCSSAFARG